MTRKLLLIDHENVHKLDLSVLDDSFRAIVFVGAMQSAPKALRNPATAHRFNRVEFRKVLGSGGNALDFHIACELGRVLESARDTICIVLSRDKGFDPLLLHLNGNGLTCHRVDDMDALIVKFGAAETGYRFRDVVCARCRRASTIEHLGGRWCTNCGRFASPPDPSQLPSMQHGHENARQRSTSIFARSEPALTCAWCNCRSDMSGGIYDDGEWMCGDCVSNFVE